MAGSSPRVLTQYSMTTLEQDLHLADGSVIPAGTEVLFAPYTVAGCVRVPGDKSLADAWENISMDGHSHADVQALLAGYQAELVRSVDRIAKIELWAAQKGFVSGEVSAGQEVQ